MAAFDRLSVFLLAFIAAIWLGGCAVSALPDVAPALEVGQLPTPPAPSRRVAALMPVAGSAEPARTGQAAEPHRPAKAAPPAARSTLPPREALNTKAKAQQAAAARAQRMASVQARGDAALAAVAAKSVRPRADRTPAGRPPLTAVSAAAVQASPALAVVPNAPTRALADGNVPSRAFAEPYTPLPLGADVGAGSAGVIGVMGKAGS